MILFLDFDGVLNIPGKNGMEVFVPEIMERLAQVVLQHNLQIVISSSWRELKDLYDLDTIREFFPETIRDRIIDVTPIIVQNKVPPYIGSVRQKEIELWVKNNSYSQQWLALDDDRFNFDKDCENLVLCGSITGFTEDVKHKLIQKIKEMHK